MARKSKKDVVEDYLEKEPLFRERRHKNRGVTNLLLKKYTGIAAALVKAGISKESLIALVEDAYTMDRWWRKHLEHRPELRGKDYGTKKMLVQKKQIELGYTPGFERDVKTLSKIK